MAHLTTLRVSTVALLLLGAACADAGGDDDDAAVGTIDAAVGTIDAPANTPDAPPEDPDAAGSDASTLDASAVDASGIDGGTSVCSDPVDLFPTPVLAATSPFTSIDDDFLEVTFGMGFTFDFYGTMYTSVFLNTNGGLTFGAGDPNYDPAATDVTVPAIAVLWGDMNAAAHGADVRANQMAYRQCDDKFIVTYTQYQDNDDPTWTNTATLSLSPNGAFRLVYGDVLSQDILVGVFDGTHTADSTSTVTGTIPYTTMGTGVILFDDFAAGPTHLGELIAQTIDYTVP